MCNDRYDVQRVPLLKFSLFYDFGFVKYKFRADQRTHAARAHFLVTRPGHFLVTRTNIWDQDFYSSTDEKRSRSK
jgi:hypothetical protein